MFSFGLTLKNFIDVSYFGDCEKYLPLKYNRLVKRDKMFDLEIENTGIGVDIEDVSRFRGLTAEKDARFLNKIFTEKEKGYCFSLARPEQHLAARFAGKEAVIKALSSLGMKKPVYRDIEILNNEKGGPGVTVLKKGYEGIHLLVSLSHSEGSAIAFVIAVKPTEK